MADGEVPLSTGPSQEDLRTTAPSTVNPNSLRDFRRQLSKGEDSIDPATWAGSVPAASGIAPRVRVGRSRWFNLLWLLPIGFVLLRLRRLRRLRRLQPRSRILSATGKASECGGPDE